MRTHISRDAVTEIRPAKTQRPSDKPLGFWYSVDGDWEEWCQSERPRWAEGKKYEVILGNEKILKITNLIELIKFNDEYACEHPVGLENFHIDWPRVAETYDGIEIAPYQSAKRYAYMWYYTWDCASGCIWRPNGVTLKEIK